MSLLEQQFKANLLLMLPKYQAISEATCSSDAFVANLESDDRADDYTTETAQHHTFNEKPIPKRRHRRCTFS